MRLAPAAVAWLAASVIFVAAALFLLANPGDDPISAGLIYFALWGSAIAAAICVIGFVASVRR